MRRRDVVLGLADASVALALTGGGEAMTGNVDLNGQVRQVADRYASAWNAADMDAMRALYTEDVHWVNIVGMHWRGLDEVDHAHRVFFGIMFKGVPIRLEEIESVAPLPGGGAVAVVRWAMGAFRTPAGQLNPPSRDRMTLVLVPRGNELAIAHGANIQIDEQAQRSDPVKRGANGGDK